MPIVQGQNTPLTIQFDQDISQIPVLVVSLWCDTPKHAGKLIKQWRQDEMTISGDIAVCQLTEEESKRFRDGTIVLEAKGLDQYGNTIFWDQYPVDIAFRNDRAIMLTQEEDDGE